MSSRGLEALKGPKRNFLGFSCLFFLSSLHFLITSNSRLFFCLQKWIYSEKATTFWEISTIYLYHVVPVKFTVELLQNFVAFSEYMNFKSLQSVCWNPYRATFQGQYRVVGSSEYAKKVSSKMGGYNLPPLDSNRVNISAKIWRNDRLTLLYSGSDGPAIAKGHSIIPLLLLTSKRVRSRFWGARA